MKRKGSGYNAIQYGLSIWQGKAPHLGRSYKESKAEYPIRASDHDKYFTLFFNTDVWTSDGWLVTSTSLSGGIVRCSVRKGTQVATLVAPDHTLFFHDDPSLPNEDCPWLASDPRFKALKEKSS